MVKCEDKFLALLPVDPSLGLTERQILSALSISHGTFFTVCRDLIEAGLVAFVRRDRVKYYYRVADDVPDDVADDVPDDVADDVPSSVTSQKVAGLLGSDPVRPKNSGGKKKKAKKISAVYDTICQGIYPDLSAFVSAVESLSGFVDAWADSERKRYYVNIIGEEGTEIWRYDYDDALPYGAVEIWRRTFDRSRQYHRRGSEGVLSILKNGSGDNSAA